MIQKSNLWRDFVVPFFEPGSFRLQLVMTAVRKTEESSGNFSITFALIKVGKFSKFINTLYLLP